jgi:polar amino acid transport system substrate-binding protein
MICFALAACKDSTKTPETTDSAKETAKETEKTTEGSAEAASANSDLAYVTANKKLVIGITAYEPMNYQDEKGEWTGFDTEFAEAVCKKLGVDAEFTVIDWDNKFFELSSKSIDCIWNGMTITDEAKQNADVTNPYVKNAQVVVMKSDKIADFGEIDTMKDLTFACEAGSAGEAVVQDLGYNLVSVAAQSDALLEVSSGSSDACVIDITMANAMTGEGTSYADLGVALELDPEEYGIAFRKGSDLVAKVNEIMAELMSDGTLDALAEKYQLTLIK